MDLPETSFWARRLFPGAARIAVRRAVLPGRRRRKARPGIPVKVAEFSLYDVPIDDDAVPDVVDAGEARFAVAADVGGDWRDDGPDGGRDGGHGGTADDAPRREIAAMTVNFGRVDLNLRTPGGDDVRVEMFLVAYPDSLATRYGGDGDDSGIARAVAGAAALVADDQEAARPTPGSVIPEAVRIGMGADFDASRSTTPHLLCVAPYVWPDGVPTITEEPGKISVHGDADGFPDRVTGRSRLTTVTQLVPITEEEYAHADAHGVESLMQLLADVDADLRDLRRASVAR
ncbi:suppressor of fused domain protein [Corynebacterium hansenii]|uniref:Suppressor of fused domain protein n=1 Tax=Corynebacterium hansenii TaxID=394964 RepID=A0ABV7ZNL8_9CORY|nr:suppressor of fused domain protein [Corynebacterium hansenii]WJY98811.1 Suppressor of fused protein (SUFU) [Corynebacterium hansenii]